MISYLSIFSNFSLRCWRCRPFPLQHLCASTQPPLHWRTPNSYELPALAFTYKLLVYITRGLVSSFCLVQPSIFDKRLLKLDFASLSWNLIFWKKTWLCYQLTVSKVKNKIMNTAKSKWGTPNTPKIICNFVTLIHRVLKVAEILWNVLMKWKKKMFRINAILMENHLEQITVICILIPVLWSGLSKRNTPLHLYKSSNFELKNTFQVDH